MQLFSYIAVYSVICISLNYNWLAFGIVIHYTMYGMAP